MIKLKRFLGYCMAVAGIYTVIHLYARTDIRVDVLNKEIAVNMSTIKVMNGQHIRSRQGYMKCGDIKCRFLFGQKDPSGADLAIFSEIDVKDYRKEPPRKGQGDLWAFLSKEAQDRIKQPKYQVKWDGMFNYSATYDRDNEGSYYIFRSELVKLQPPGSRLFRPKPKMRPLRALWFISHCSEPGNDHDIHSAREEYALELSKYMQIDVFTSAEKDLCPKRLGSLVKDRGVDKEPQMEDYMFYLAFENCLCKDYITEKLWRVLESNSTTIPIVLGGIAVEDYKFVAPPNSFIHVKNFTSPEALAKHLKFVSEDDNAFHYYNQWRNEFWLKTRHVYNHGSDHLYHGDFYCYFCKLLQVKPQRVWKTFSKDYGGHNCQDISDPKQHCPYYNLTCNDRR